MEDTKQMQFDISKIKDIQCKIQSKVNIPTTEEATKQWYVMPLLVALGYDPFSSDILPEYTLDVGTKQGEKVDYALQINNQPVAIVECKQFNTQLSDKHISQLYRYFAITDVHIAILTNGDDYWFFTDSNKPNIMDLIPYYKVRISDASENELLKLEMYSKDSIQRADVNKVVQQERFKTACKELITGLRDNQIPAWLLIALAQKAGIQEADKSILAEHLYNEVKSVFNIDGLSTNATIIPESETDTTISGSASTFRHNGNLSARAESKKYMSNIKLNHYYVFNDYSDGDWKHHKLDKALIFGKEYENINGKALLINTIERMFELNKFTRESILAEPRFDVNYRINATPDGGTLMKYLETYDVYVETSWSLDGIVRFISKLCDFAGVTYDNIKIAFKE